jgi:hypothetical protein
MLGFSSYPLTALQPVYPTMEQLCPTCAALRREWLDAIEKWSAVTRLSNDAEQEAAARLDEHRAFCKYIEWHYACKECSRTEP